MQTLDHRPPVATAEPVVTTRRRRRPWVIVAGAAALVLATAALTYAIVGTSSTKTIVRTEAPAAAAPTAAPKCLPGAAPGSCNIDEANEANIPDKPLSAATRTELAAQLTAARNVALKYPTVAAVRRVGWTQAGKFSPLTGAHFINIGAVGGNFDPSNPGSLIYDGISPTSKVIGVMYLSMSLNPPEGFVGPNDHWHRHTNTCVQYKTAGIVIPFAADSSVTKAQCDAVGGQFMRETVWMVHAWVVPGWESPRGVFAHDNPDVLCKNGTTKTDAIGFCAGT